ncbi:MAG TPA: cytochrome P460 family protein [Blastocatellia bacterium]|nr:cytochrome P460 family protein [Blastocatellia bacterium]
MISRIGLKTIICILLVLSFCALERVDSQVSAPSDDLESLKAELSKYKTWTLVNPKPVLMDPVVAVACAAPNTSAPNPHSNKYIRVYVNEVGSAAMMSEKHPRFPQGSIIVKEKLSEATSRLPELLTIMVKRNEGYDQGNGDWDYLVVNGDGSRVERPTNVRSCQACHLAHKESDYVSRIYLPKDIREKLK